MNPYSNPHFKAEALKVSEEDYSAFMEALEKCGDALSVLLKGHLFAEAKLEHIIVNALPKGVFVIEQVQLSFKQKLVLVDSFQLVPKKFISSLNQLNKLRNNCAHKLDQQITVNDIVKIGSPVGQQFTKMRDVADGNEQELLKMLLSLVCSYFSTVEFEQKILRSIRA